MAYRQTAITQQRRTESRERFLGAARELFGARGYNQTTTRDIVDRAGSSTGNLYFYFPDKESILRVLVTGAFEQAEMQIDRALALVPAGASQLAAAVIVATESLLEQADLARIIFVETPQSGFRSEALERFSKRVSLFFSQNEQLVNGAPVDIAAACWVGAIWQAAERNMLSSTPLASRELGLALARWNLRALGIPSEQVEMAVSTAIFSLNSVAWVDSEGI